MTDWMELYRKVEDDVIAASQLIAGKNPELIPFAIAIRECCIDSNQYLIEARNTHGFSYRFEQIREEEIIRMSAYLGLCKQLLKSPLPKPGTLFVGLRETGV